MGKHDTAYDPLLRGALEWQNELTNALARGEKITTMYVAPGDIVRICREWREQREALRAWWDDPDNPPALAAQLAAERDA